MSSTSDGDPAVEYSGVRLHNVAELDERGEGVGLQRVPESVRRELNPDAQGKARRPAATELRFRTDEAAVAVTLSAPGDPVEAVPFWGPFQSRERYTVGAEPTTIELQPHDRVAAVDPDVADGLAFDPGVWRVVLQDGPNLGNGTVRFHGVDGDVRPPDPDDVPDTRYLAYGTSITQGGSASHGHLAYPSRVARRLGTDLVNLGFSGSAYCEPAIADHIAAREDWDVATLGLSVNMANQGFELGEFRRRVAYMVETVADADPDRPVVAITLFTYYPDLGVGTPPDARAEAAEFREALRGAVADADRPNLHLVEGRELLDPGGLSVDLLHPADDGMIQMGERLADRVEPLL